MRIESCGQYTLTTSTPVAPSQKPYHTEPGPEPPGPYPFKSKLLKTTGHSTSKWTHNGLRLGWGASWKRGIESSSIQAVMSLFSISVDDIYIYMYTHIHIHIYMYTYIRTHKYIHTHTYTYIHIYIYTYMSIHTPISASCRSFGALRLKSRPQRAPPSMLSGLWSPRYEIHSQVPELL